MTGEDASILVTDEMVEDASILVTDEMVEAFYLVGPESRLQERVDEYREAGVDLPLLLPRLEDYRHVVETFRR